jgi:nucleoside-diphosphate-sugar epimerase
VTGAAGGFGRDLVPWLAKRHEVRATDIVPAQVPCEFVQADLRDPRQVGPLVEGIQGVVHLAVLLPRDHVTADFVDVNVKATTLLCEAAAQAGVQRLLYISTVWVTGHGVEEGPSPVNEAAPWTPLEMYGLTKLQGELAAEFFAHCRGLSALVLRMGGYERCSEIAPDGSVDLATANLAALAHGHLREGQKLCNPNDLGRVMEAALELPAVAFDRLIVANHVRWQPDEAEQLRTDPEAIYERHYPGLGELLAAHGAAPAPVSFWYSTEKARRLLGFEHEHSIEAFIAAHRRGR